ncbi:MAG: rod shape-determining protein RodA [Chloroflexi bacterium]|nr:rod shape-determining protein RodA [Chloroflexota bacterium]
MNLHAWRRLDWALLGAVLALVLFGAAMIDSATVNSPGLEDYARRHLIFGAMGVVLLLLLAVFDYRLLGPLQWPLYALTIALLLLVDATGEVRGGAQRWLNLGVIEVQPSELGKGLLLIVLSHHLAQRRDRLNRLTTLVEYALILFPPLALIYAQPDLGTTISLLFLAGGLLFIAGVPWRYIIGLAVATVLSFPLVWASLDDYMRRRVLVFLNPNTDPQAVYNVKQALIAVGSGGLVGKGYKLGTQSQLHFLRVRHTDFIFPVIAEELGFLGSLVLLALFFFVLYRLLRISLAARDMFGRLLAAGVALILFFQIFVNVGMNVGLLPVTGIPLPFVSYGGSHLVTMLALIGLAQSVHVYRRPGG